MTDTPTFVEQPPLPQWLSDYLNRLGLAPDTLLQEQGDPLLPLLSRLAGLTADDMNTRASEVKRLLLNSGFVDVGESRNKWSLDVLPYLLTSQQWQQLTEGLTQRVQLINHLLADLKGPRQLVMNGVIDAKRVFQHPLYPRESHALGAQDTGLFLYALDIGQDENGDFYVLRDHCQFPRGLGLLLENRIVARRVMSEEFAEFGVQRIARFFQSVRRAITASGKNSDPRVVILSQGPDDPYYFEQAYLATYLGFTLVRSADLTVRKGKVWLKALNGLRKVDVIVRWVEDRYLDSLEQTDYSLQGVPGLLQAIRSQSVTVLNPFGNGMMQIPALRQALPNIAQQLTGAPLILKEPECRTLDEISEGQWGDYELRSHQDVDFRIDAGREPKRVKEAMASDRRVHLYFWRKIKLKTVPFWHHKQLIIKPTILRCFALCHEGQVQVLPSALCSSIAQGDADARIYIKDTWVPMMGPPEPDQQGKAAARKRHSDIALMEGEIPSRTAESLFWLGSGLERGEDSARLLRIYLDRITEFNMYPEYRHNTTISLLRQGMIQGALLYPYANWQDADDVTGVPNKAIAVQLLRDETNPGSLASIVGLILSTALQVRELLSYDSLRIIEQLEGEHRQLTRLQPLSPTHVLQSSLDNVIGQIMAFNGSIVDSMSYRNGAFVLEIGRRIERCHQLVAMIQVMLSRVLPEADEQSALDALLVAQVSSVTHRRRYRMYQGIDTALELLLLDVEYPRSLAYQLEQLERLCEHLPAKQKGSVASELQKLLLRLKAECYLIQPETVSRDQDGQRSELSELMSRIQLLLQGLKDLLQTSYFTHTKTPSKLAWENQASSRGQI